MSKFAMAHAMKKRMAKGGMLTKDGYQSECDENCNHPDMPHPKASGYEPMPEEHVKEDMQAHMEDDRDLNQHGDDEVGPEGDHADKEDGFYAMGGRIEPMSNEQDKDHEMDMVRRVMKKRQMMYSEGGKVANNTHSFEEDFKDPNEFDDLVLDDNLKSEGTDNEIGNPHGADHDDVVARIMMKRKKQHNPKPA